MIPLFDINVNDDKYIELIQQAKTTLNNKKKFFGKHIYNLSNNKYIVDEHFGLTETDDGMIPQEFVDKLVNVTTKDNLHL